MDRRRWTGLVAAALVALVVLAGGGLLAGGPGGSGPAVQDGPARTAASTDPASGLVWVAESALPAEARQTLALVDVGGPYPYDQDDETFFNREGLLPERPESYYREYTVRTPGEQDRGARRIVAGDGGEYYWTEDHYASFRRIERSEG